MDIKGIQTLSFEDGYDRLEQLIQQLEAGSLSLEESVALYEEGVVLAKHCGRKLDDAELRVMELLNEAAEEEQRGQRWAAESL
jgi:exodeoxyribonuclease VII small subunit